MNKSLIATPEAEADLVEAYRWYEDQVVGLGDDLLSCVDEVMASIERNPLIYPVVHRGVIRRALTRRFPFGVFFINGERNIVIIGIIHERRNPQTWQDRL